MGKYRMKIEIIPENNFGIDEIDELSEELIDFFRERNIKMTFFSCV